MTVRQFRNLYGLEARYEWQSIGTKVWVQDALTGYEAVAIFAQPFGEASLPPHLAEQLEIAHDCDPETPEAISMVGSEGICSHLNGLIGLDDPLSEVWYYATKGEDAPAYGDITDVVPPSHAEWARERLAERDLMVLEICRKVGVEATPAPTPSA